jgi:hypothetical protein
MINQDSLFNAMNDALKKHDGIATNIVWNNGRVRCFLFDGFWFPLRSTVNYALLLQGDAANATTAQCQTHLENLLFPLNPVLRDVVLYANQLQEASISDKIEGRKEKRKAIIALNKNNQLILEYA